MKHKKSILMGAFLLLALSCTDTEVSPPSPTSVEDRIDQEGLSAGLPMGPRSGNRAGIVMPPNQVSTQTLSNGINTNLIGTLNYKLNPSRYTRYQSGVPYVNLGHVIGNPVFAYPSQWNLILSGTVPAVFPYDAVRADFSYKLNQMTVGVKFKKRVLNLFDVARNIEGYSYTAFINFLNSQLHGIANDQRTWPDGSLSNLEKFGLTQAVYHVKFMTESSYSRGTACLPQTREEWKEVAKAAIVGGLGGGLALGWKGAVAGAGAALPNPILGAAVGGGIGFITGFIGGALMGGGIHMMADCMINKLFNPLLLYACGGASIDQFGDFRDSPSPPTTCLTNWNPNWELSTQLPIVPNLGAQVVNPGVIADINWMLSYL